MKKKIVMAMLTCIALRAVSQQDGGGAISYLPYQASNYLILDQTNYTDVAYWNVNIQIKSVNANQEIFYRTVQRYELWGTYFTRIPANYADGDYYLQVFGMNASGEIIVQEGPVPVCPGCPTDGQACSVICEGPTYAWKGTYFADGNGGNISLSVFSTQNPITGQPYYQYFSQSQFNALPSSGPSEAYYNIGGYYWPQTNKVIKITVSPGTTNIKDAGGNILTGVVYGVQKYKGPWYATSDITATNIAGDFEVLCSNDVPQVVSIINTNTNSSSLSPDLYCDGSSIGVPPAGEGIPATEAEFFALDCEDLINEQFVGIDGNIYEFIEYFDCENESTIFNWPSNVAAVNIAPFVNPNGQFMTIAEEDLYLPNGEFNAPAVNLDRGLYMIGIQFNDNSYYTVFVESKEPNTSVVPQSSLLAATAFPVPIIGDEFTLRLQAYAKLKFDYTLLDLNGTVLYRKNFVLQKDHDQTHSIRVHDGIPSGQLVNKFVFEDGSELVFQTLK